MWDYQRSLPQDIRPPASGGEWGERRDLNDYMRWQVSGMLPVNCQSCHNADPGQSQAEYGVQVMRQNFRWAAAASSGCDGSGIRRRNAGRL